MGLKLILNFKLILKPVSRMSQFGAQRIENYFGPARVKNKFC